MKILVAVTQMKYLDFFFPPITPRSGNSLNVSCPWSTWAA